MRVEWLDAALKGLDEQAEFIAKDNPAAAHEMVLAVFSAVNNLAKFPALGRPGRVEGTRELVVTGTPFIVPYRVRGKVVEVLRVLHASRIWPDDF